MMHLNSFNLLFLAAFLFECCAAKFLPICTSSITKHLSKLLSTPEAVSLPYGRAFVAFRFGLALYIDSSTLNRDIVKTSSNNPVNTHEIFNWSIPIDSSWSLSVRACALPVDMHKSSSIQRGNESDVCSVTLFSRLVGPEVVVGEVHLIETDELKSELPNSILSTLPNSKESSIIESCMWSIRYPPVFRDGNYALDTYTMWANELIEPEGANCTT